jgi:type IV pilus assembly protein PilW
MIPHTIMMKSPSLIGGSLPKRQQMGVSLIELMIGIAIGMIVVVAAVGSLMYTRVSSSTVGDSTRLYQDASTAFRIIGNQIRQGGARRIQGAGGSTVQFNSTYVGFSTTTTTLVADGTEGASGATDTFRISRDIEPVIDARDCLGQSPAGANINNTFTVTGGELQCLGSATGATTQAIAAGVEDLQVWYGVRSGDNLRYRVASAVASWDDVEVLMVCLRMAGDTTNNPGAASTGCNGEAIANDGRIRRVFFRVFNIRNMGL